MKRGRSLKKDLRFLLNNQKYSDVEILCSDEEKFYCSRNILSARSEIFDGLLYNEESYETQISFPTIDSSVMKIVLEYIYTGSIEEESLNKDNVFEVFNVADYFQLPVLQDFIMEIFKNNLVEKNYVNFSPEFLSRAVDIMPLSKDNILLTLLVKTVATIPLNEIEFGRLSVKALRYLLSYAHEKEMTFVTTEYEIFRYSAILAAKQVSNDTYNTFMERLPTLEQIEKVENSVQVNTTDRQEVAKEIESFIKFIDFSKIKGQILANIVEPLEIVPDKIILDAYRKKAVSNFIELDEFRSMTEFSEPNYVWDESACGSKLFIMENGNIIQSTFGQTSLQSVRAEILLEYNKGIFEWDVIIEQSCRSSYVGVCASENFDYQAWAGNQSTGWVLCSNGSCYNSGVWMRNYCPTFADCNNIKITVHLDMNRTTIAFTVSGIKYPEVWYNLPAKLYPVVSLRYPGRFRIKSHRKN
ncbi:unnamed protein product [Rhizophagus irregularis]|uniref:Btb/poz domain containing protein n=1 Tax=Rhizophagus irregularis TaxID=588596 RepID=A0A916E5S4_9GLOM|nr:unnamed protein product [Rhizophagus irregularis]CAB5356904.1 unnamed protein product [Rhizophagus irregularis]